MKQNIFEQTHHDTYGTIFVNSNIAKNDSCELHMENHGYERTEVVTSAGMKICFEFPQSVQNEKEIVQEVRSILSGELRDCMEKCVG